MQVLSVASEVYPLVKTGGLADVAGALPLALKGHGVSVKTLMPGYPAVMRAVKDARLRLSFENLLGARADLLEVEYQGLDLLILDSPTFFDRPGGPYVDAASKDHFDNWRRFAALSKAGAMIAQGAMADSEEGWRPDIVHVHDWQAAMVPAYMRYSNEREVPTLITIHNIAFQGQYGADIFPYLELPAHAFGIEGVEYFGGVGYLKAGLQTSLGDLDRQPFLCRGNPYPRIRHGPRRPADAPSGRPARHRQRHRRRHLGPSDRPRRQGPL